MSHERIERSKSAIEGADHISAEKKSELLGLLSRLKPAIEKVSETHERNAQNIADLVEASTHEATRDQKSPERLKTLLHKLKESVEEFEASHPELVAFVVEYSALLSALGI